MCADPQLIRVRWTKPCGSLMLPRVFYNFSARGVSGLRWRWLLGSWKQEAYVKLMEPVHTEETRPNSRICNCTRRYSTTSMFNGLGY